jgi:hypothetical protein
MGSSLDILQGRNLRPAGHYSYMIGRVYKTRVFDLASLNLQSHKKLKLTWKRTKT